MRISVCCALAGILSLTAADLAVADTLFQATLTHDQEVSNPPIPNEGSSGVGTFVLNAAMNQLSYDVILSGLDLDGNQTPGDPNDNVTRVHFHAAPAGTNGGIVFGIIDGNPAFQNDNNPNDLVVNAATGRITGVWNAPEGNATTLNAQLANLFANGLYFNVHTSDHAGGEIRGQVIQVPEPSTIVLTALAFGCLASVRRKHC